MIRLRILEILEEQDHTKYWLFKRMDMLSYRNFQKIIENRTTGIKFETLNKLCRVLDVPVGELFAQDDNFKNDPQNVSGDDTKNANQY